MKLRSAFEILLSVVMIVGIVYGALMPEADSHVFNTVLYALMASAGCVLGSSVGRTVIKKGGEQTKVKAQKNISKALGGHANKMQAVGETVYGVEPEEDLGPRPEYDHRIDDLDQETIIWFVRNQATWVAEAVEQRAAQREWDRATKERAERPTQLEAQIERNRQEFNDRVRRNGGDYSKPQDHLRKVEESSKHGSENISPSAHDPGPTWKIGLFNGATVARVSLKKTKVSLAKTDLVGGKIPSSQLPSMGFDARTVREILDLADYLVKEQQQLAEMATKSAEAGEFEAVHRIIEKFDDSRARLLRLPVELEMVQQKERDQHYGSLDIEALRDVAVAHQSIDVTQQVHDLEENGFAAMARQGKNLSRMTKVTPAAQSAPLPIQYD